MRVICLNTWGGRAGKELLLDFFRRNADADVFCLQEIWSAPYEHLEGKPAGGRDIQHESIMVYGLQDISNALPDHQAFFRPHHLDNYGLLMLVKKELSVLEEGDVFVFRERGYIPEGDVGNHARNLQYATIATTSGPRTIINFHGMWTPIPPGKFKLDTPDRLLQSEKILQFLGTLTNPFLLCGDFNLLPETESIRKFEDAGLRNLITEFNIPTTRTSFYKKDGKFADYAFLSSDARLIDFQVMPDEVSDHAPLRIDFA